MKSIYEALADMPAEERTAFVGSKCIGVMRLEKLGVRRAAKLEALCPAALSEKILGAPASCEGLNRPGGRCSACTERFLRMDWPERGEADG